MGGDGERQLKKKNRTEENSAERRKRECGCRQEEMTESESFSTCADTLRFCGDGGKLLLFQFLRLFWGVRVGVEAFK